MKGFDWTMAYPYFENYKHALLGKNGTIAGLSNDDGAETYNLLAESINNYYLLEGDQRLTPKAVYLAFKRHVHKVFPNFAPAVSDSDCDSDGDLFDIYDELSSNTLLVEVDNDLLEPLHTVLGRRIRQRLAPGWSAKLSKVISKAVKATQCVFTFKNHEFVDGEISTIARCNDCGAFVKVRGIKATRQIELHFVRGLDTEHSRKRRIFGDERKALCKKAKFQSSLNVQNDIIEHEFDPDEDLNCNILPSLKKISQMRHEEIKREYLHEDVFEALDILNESSDTRFRNCIRVVSRRPFVVIFWLPIQKELFDVLSKKHRVTLFIDLTGSIVRAPLKNIDGTLPSIYIYNIVMCVDGMKSIPVGHFISSRHTAFQIYCLGVWLQDFHIPAEITIDFSPALLAAVV